MSKSSRKQESLKKKHWSVKSQESLISRNRDGHFCLNVEGGAEVGLFPFLGDIKQDKIHYHRGKVHPGELILAVNNKKVAGMIKKDVIALIKRSADPVSLVTVRQNATITRDIRQYLATRFTKTSVDSELQHQIRENLHMRVVPCTTRPPHPGERHGVDYNFITVDEFKRMEKSGELLESGVYEGNYYGTPRPPADPPSSDSFPAYSRSPASLGYSKEGVIPTSAPPGEVGSWRGAAPPVNIPKNLGPLPANWEIAYTENNEKYFIDHSTGTTHWLDPRLARYLKHSILECNENELPYGWEKVNDPMYGTYFIDHINRVTQYENPIIEAKRKHAGAQLPHAPGYNDPPPSREPPPSFQSTAAEEKRREAEAAAMWPDAGLQEFNGQLDPQDYNDAYPYPYPIPSSDEELESALQGQVLVVTLQKTDQGFGFTIIGGDRPGELLQIRNIVRGSVADMDGQLQIGDVLVRINRISVLTYSHRKVVELFQSLTFGSDVGIEVRRGYPLPDAQRPPDDLPAYNESNQEYDMGDRVMVHIIKGPLGFGFSLGESQLGPAVKLIMDHPRCAQLSEGDIILEVNGENVQNYPHPALVDVLKRCPKGNQASFVVLRGGQNGTQPMPSYVDDGPPRDGEGDEPFATLVIRLLRQVSGFGFRIIGGQEEGSQATVGAIVSGGAADVDGRLVVGDEITHINNHSVKDASHRDVISLMGQAAAMGEVILGIERKMPLPESLSPTSGVTGGGGGGYGGGVFDKQDFGSRQEADAALEISEIPQGIRAVVIDRPNTQTSFGFVLQSNTLRAGCMICRLIPDSPADRSGKLYMYDELLAVNGHDVSSMDHGDIVTRIKASDQQIKLSIQQPEDLEAITRQQMISEQQQQQQNIRASPENLNFGSPSHQGGYQGQPPPPQGRGYQQDHVDGGYPMDGRHKQGFQDFPGGDEEQPPQISADISDIASDDEEILHIDIRRSGGGFGFSIRGGAEYSSPLCVLRIADGGAAEKDGRLRVGDELLEINGNSTESMLHSDAITIIKHGGDAVKLIIRRLAEEVFMGGSRYKSGQDEVMFSPTAVQTNDRYAQEYTNSYNRSRDSSRDPNSPPA